MAGEDKVHIFHGEGYRLWAVVAEGRLRERNLFRYVERSIGHQPDEKDWEEYISVKGEDGSKAKEEYENRKKIAFSVLASLIDWSILRKFPRVTEPAELWEALRERYASTDLGNRASLHRKLCTMSSNTFKTLDDYVSKVEETISQLEAAGEEITDETACIHLLKGLDPHRYQAFLDGVEARDGITFAWLATKIRNLHRAPERPEKAYNAATPKSVETKCRFCNGEWHKKCPYVICHTCRKEGHFARDCPKKDSTRPKGQVERSNWVLDSGATSSMTSDETELVDLEIIPQRRVTVANGEEIICSKKGKLRLRARNGIETVLEDVLVVPGLREKLISVRNLQNNGYEVKFGQEGCCVSKHGDTVIEAKDGKYGLYEIDCLMARTEEPRKKPDTLKGWHERLGHLSENQILNLTRDNKVVGIKIQGSDSITCQACAEGKQTSTPHQRTSERMPERPGEMVSTDVIGPIRPLGYRNEKFISVIVDHYTGWTSANPIMTKSTEDVLNHVKEVTSFIKTQTGQNVRILRTDSATEYLTDRFEQWIAAQGMLHETTAPYCPASNGKVERLNRTITELIRTQMASSEVERNLWPHAAVNAAYLINRTTITPYTKRTPYENIFGTVPNVYDLIAFGKPCYMKTEGPRQKLSSKSTLGTVLGKREGLDGYLVRLSGGGIAVSRNIMEINPAASRVELIREDELEIEEESESEEEGDEQEVDDSHQIEESANYTHTQKEEDNPSLAEALDSNERDEWNTAINCELRNLREYKVFERLPASPGDKPIKTKFVLTRKRGPNGEILKYKARLVALGYKQRAGTDYGETFAPVCREESIRILIHLATVKNLLIHQIDVDAAYLNAELKEKVLIEPPKLIRDKLCGPNETLRLKKALYGLKQAGYEWYQTIRGTLRELGWTQGKVDPCLFTRERQNKTEYLALYVDDILVVAPTKEDIDKIKNELGSVFALKDTGEMRNLLGMKIERIESGRYAISQPKTVRALISEIPGTNRRSIPMGRTDIEPNETRTPEGEVKKYQATIGSLLYLSRKSRPDITYAVGALARWASDPPEKARRALDWLVDYVRYTPDYHLEIRGGDLKLVAWSDASFAENGDRKSTSGYVVKIGNTTIVWGSKRQTIVATSTLEAEYVALSECTRAVLWVKMLLEHDLREKAGKLIKIHCDNMGAIEVARNPTHHFKSKHIDVKYHHVRDLIESEQIELSFVNSTSNIADVMTKPLNKSSHHNHRVALGVIKASGGVLDKMPC